jgi:protein-disulfide isomerase
MGILPLIQPSFSANLEVYTMRNSTVLISALVIGALIGGGAMGIPSIRQKLIAPQQAAPAPVEQAASQAPQAETEQATTETAAPTATAAETTPAQVEQVTPAAGFNVKTALQDRVLGDANAPVTFYDYSSLSCPHCADFHNNVLPEIKRTYIDSGKVKMVFRPFPLNEPALMAEKLARCVPESEYFPMLDLLFSNQKKWLYGNPEQNLRQLVKVAGVTDELFDSCIANKELEEGIIAMARQGSQTFNIKGTPTFVFGEDNTTGEVVAGENNYPAFSARLDKLLSDKMVSTPGKN